MSGGSVTDMEGESARECVGLAISLLCLSGLTSRDFHEYIETCTRFSQL